MSENKQETEAEEVVPDWGRALRSLTCQTCNATKNVAIFSEDSIHSVNLLMDPPEFVVDHGEIERGAALL